MPQFFEELLRGEQATTAVEYAVMLALILMTAIVAITSFGSATGSLWGDINSDIVNQTGVGS